MATPLPKAIIGVLICGKEFGVPNEKIGYMVGILVSCTYIGRLATSFLSGYMVDKYGGKFSLLVFCFGESATTLLFGFTQNYKWAIASRILMGTTLNYWVAINSFIAKVCDKTNQNTAFAYITTARSLGMILGQVIGGLTSFPAEQYPSIFKPDGVFGRFKILLPNLIISLGIGIVGIAGLIFLPKDEFCENQEKDPEKEEMIETEANTISNKIKNIKLLNIIRDRDVILVVLVGFIWVIVIAGVNEMIPLFLSTSLAYNGLNYNTSQIGLLLLVAMLPTVPIELVVTKKVGKWLGGKKMLTWANVLTAIILPLLPVAYWFHQNSYGTYAYVVIFNVIVRTLQGCGLCGLCTLLCNCVSVDRQGTLCGLMIFVYSLSRIIGPLVLGSSYAWSLGNVSHNAHEIHLGFPFNQYFVFLLLSVIALIVPVLCCFISNSLSFSKEERKEK